MTEHTPVWTYDKSEDSPKYYVCKNHKRVHGIELDTADIAQELARLLNLSEAAPDLLEALKLAKKLADAVVKQVSGDNIEVLMTRATINAAISKATS